ncbi:mitochondrial S-adenosylmethionine carrier protein isoform X1 [Tursiops truncatus]|uniref:mitochondrial S-adenosylmethionine carrier protein isoform X1 n=1 Tax=Tursiops truncatus TaxID=9739 RepID=UPI003CCF618B
MAVVLVTIHVALTGTRAGGVAGVCVDLILFPLDTIKTRLQSPQGFNKAGGFRGIYAGVPSAAIGSFPNAAAFFITYEYVKWFLHTDSSSYLMPVKHMLAASAGEVVACLIRVPSEVVKQRAQVSASSGTFHIFSNILCQEGIQGLYRGYKSTVLREIPFSLVQFPLWESLKALWSWRQDHVVDSWQSAVCGAFAGGFAAAVTTPLDVAKTRIMLAKAGSSPASGNVLSALHGVWRTRGLSGLFAGVFPRMAAISLGGFIFLGAYDQTRSFLLELGRESP